MKILHQMNLTELSSLEQQEIQGGDTMVSYEDPKGYLWMYYYKSNGDLYKVTVTAIQCIM